MQASQGGTELLDADNIFKESSLKENMWVADLGCGNTGHFVFPLSKAVGEEGMVYAVDVFKPALDGVDSRNKIEGRKNVQLVWSNLEIFGATKIEPNSLDIGFIINTLHQSKKQPAIIRESVRLIKTGGELVIVDWESHSLPLGPSFGERVTKKDLKNFAKEFNLTLLKDFKASEYHFGLVFRKQ